jgi:hypothetical protein
MSGPAGGDGTHRALLYRDEPEFRGTVGAFIREGLARRERIATAPLDRLDWIARMTPPRCPVTCWPACAEPIPS